MINLNKNITSLNLTPLIIFKLKKLEFTKIGDLVMTSYPELFYTKLFSNKELATIQNSLTQIGLDYISEIDLTNIPYLKKNLLIFNFKEYQKQLYKIHHEKYDENKIEQLKYSDPIYIVKYLLFMYEQLYSNKITPDTKVLLDNFLKKYPYMTIADFVYIRSNDIDSKIIDLIDDILGLPINSKLSYIQMLDRENSIFNRETVASEKIQSYIENFSSEKAVEDFINNTKRKNPKKL